jgi:cytoskeletal protein CcmA (bactofilin family)
MLYPAQNQASKVPPTPTSQTPVKTVGPPVEQATIGRSLFIKGEVTGSEPLYIDGRVEGSIHLPGNRVTIGQNGSVVAHIEAKEVIILGTVKGNIQCSDRLEIRSAGSLTGDVVSQRISVEDGAMLKGSVEVQLGMQKREKEQSPAASKPTPSEKEKAKAAAVGG